VPITETGFITIARLAMIGVSAMQDVTKTEVARRLRCIEDQIDGVLRGKKTTAQTWLY
jgi:hypothetical protein